MYELRTYVAANGKDVFVTWQDGLRDSKARLAVRRRINHVVEGNFGDHKFCADGVWELRIDVGVGYRVYYAITGGYIVLLLGGGDKGSQTADIKRAIERYEGWKERANERS